MRHAHRTGAAWLACAMALAAWAGGALAQRERTPAVNLQVQWRWLSVQPSPTLPAQGQGSVTVGTGGSTVSRASVTLRSASHDEADETVQQVQVLNGGHTSVRLTRGHAINQVELFMTPRGSGGVVHQVWVESVKGLEMHPRWPGGTAPVDVELVAQASAPGTSAPLAQQVSTRMLVPLGQWVTVARSAEAERAVPAGALSTQALARDEQRELQLRILPP